MVKSLCADALETLQLMWRSVPAPLTVPESKKEQDKLKVPDLDGWFFKHVLFSSRILGEDEPILTNIFGGGLKLPPTRPDGFELVFGGELFTTYHWMTMTLKSHHWCGDLCFTFKTFCMQVLSCWSTLGLFVQNSTGAALLTSHLAFNHCVLLIC